MLDFPSTYLLDQGLDVLVELHVALLSLLFRRLQLRLYHRQLRDTRSS